MDKPAMDMEKLKHNVLRAGVTDGSGIGESKTGTAALAEVTSELRIEAQEQFNVPVLGPQELRQAELIQRLEELREPPALATEPLSDPAVISAWRFNLRRAAAIVLIATAICAIVWLLRGELSGLFVFVAAIAGIGIVG